MGTERYIDEIHKIIFGYVNNDKYTGYEIVAHSLPLDDEIKKQIYKLIQLPSSKLPLFSNSNQVLWRHLGLTINQKYYHFLCEYGYNGTDNFNRLTYNSTIFLFPMVNSSADLKRINEIMTISLENTRTEIDSFTGNPNCTKGDLYEFAYRTKSKLIDKNLEYRLFCDLEEFQSVDEKRFQFIQILFCNPILHKREFISTHEINFNNLHSAFPDLEKIKYQIINSEFLGLQWCLTLPKNMSGENNEEEIIESLKLPISKKTYSIYNKYDNNSANFYLDELLLYYIAYKKKNISLKELINHIPELSIFNSSVFLKNVSEFYQRQLNRKSKNTVISDDLIFEFVGFCLYISLNQLYDK